MLLTLLAFILILSILVFVHELGHFLVAKRSGIKVEEFGFGLPPRVWGKKVGETVYSVNLLPIGGFVRLYGEDIEAKGASKDKNRQFLHKSKKIRAAVTVAGVVMNFLLAIVIFSALYTKLGIPVQTDQVKITEVFSGSPAQQAGISVGDVVVSADNQAIHSSEQFIGITRQHAGEKFNLEVKRDGTTKQVKVEARQAPPAGEGPLGIGISDVDIRFYPFWEMPFRGMAQGLKESLAWTVLILQGLWGMVVRLVTSGSVPQDIAGPVGIYQLTGQVAKTGGLLSLLQFLGVLSINLGIVNLLPIPALDGGRLLFIGLEAVIGRRVKPKIEAYAHQFGLLFLLFLLFLITWHDIARIVVSTGLGDRLRELIPNR